MAEYTLLKKYPNLPKNWEVGMLVGIGDGKSAYTPCSSKYVVMQIAAENVQNFPEYWEKVKEKEYEILSFIFVGVEKTIVEIENGYLKGHATLKILPESYYLESKLWNIHSIKRLSDGEVFTLGDECYYGHRKDSFTIKEIEYETAPADRGKKVLTFITSSNVLGKWLILSKITKIKYLFTSDDSIGIMKGDEYVTVAKSNFDITEGNIANTVPDNQLFWRFKTKEAAEDWVLMNKPTFSVNDLSHFINVNEESHTILARRFLTAHMSTNKSNDKDF